MEFIMGVMKNKRMVSEMALTAGGLVGVVECIDSRYRAGKEMEWR